VGNEKVYQQPKMLGRGAKIVQKKYGTRALRVLKIYALNYTILPILPVPYISEPSFSSNVK